MFARCGLLRRACSRPSLRSFGAIAMERRFPLTEDEQRLRHLLLDVAAYIGRRDGYREPDLRFTGGWVRDKLLGQTSSDIDVAIDNLTGGSFGSLMKEYLEQESSKAEYPSSILGHLATIKENPEKSKHLETVNTKIYGIDVDLVNLRKETYTEHSRNPEMQFGSAEEDALRRDATVNAIFYRLATDQVEDLTGQGLDDMKQKLIRTPLDPYQTFKDDPLRILRCIRFASRLSYAIDPRAEKCMGVASILEALKLKISRERVGIEITKMLKGPYPRTALAAIDRLGLYGTVFTDPSDSSFPQADTVNWHVAYDALQDLLANSEGKSIGTVRRVLLGSNTSRDLQERAWLLCSLVPWGAMGSNAVRLPRKQNGSHAARVVASGLKLDHYAMQAADDAVVYQQEVSALVREHAELSDCLNDSGASKRKLEDPNRRVALGMAIRRWASRAQASWRLTVLYSFLVDIAASSQGIECMPRHHEPDLTVSTERDQCYDRYAAWLGDLEAMDLLDVDKLAPLVSGNDIRTVVDLKPGPWMTEATRLAIEWQLRNPGSEDRTQLLESVASQIKSTHAR